MVADRIKTLREENQMTQAELARRLSITRASDLNITRSSVNAWEMGISVPSTQYIVELAGIFHISTDYLLDVDRSASINIAGLTEADVRIVYALVEHLRRSHTGS